MDVSEALKVSPNNSYRRSDLCWLLKIPLSVQRQCWEKKQNCVLPSHALLFLSEQWEKENNQGRSTDHSGVHPNAR